MFISFYFLVLTLLLYFKNRTTLFEFPKFKKFYSISVIIPIYNEEKSIVETIKSIYALDYPLDKLEVIAVNDGSRDNSFEVLKMCKSEYPLLKIINKTNSGKADSVNTALKLCTGELVVVLDADSYPAKDSFKKMIGYFDDPEVGAATLTCTPKNRGTFLEKLQVIEYKVIAFTRKLLEYVDSIYVVPGTAGMYRKKALEDIGGFDKNNITEDIEATWHLIHNGWKVKMCLAAHIHTDVPSKIKPWYTQRRRWSLGGLQCISKYKNNFFNGNLLGFFVVPFFTLGLFLGLIGILIFLYIFIRRFISSFLLVQFGIISSTPIVTFNDFYFTPSVLNYFGIVLFVLFFIFTIFVLAVLKDNLDSGNKGQSFFNLLFYMTIYLLVYPIVLVVSMWHYFRGKNVWR